MYRRRTISFFNEGVVLQVAKISLNRGETAVKVCFSCQKVQNDQAVRNTVEKIIHWNRVPGPKKMLMIVKIRQMLFVHYNYILSITVYPADTDR